MKTYSKPIVIQLLQEKQKLNSALKSCDDNITKLIIKDLRDLESHKIDLDEYENRFDETKKIRSNIKTMISFKDLL